MGIALASGAKAAKEKCLETKRGLTGKNAQNLVLVLGARGAEKMARKERQ